MIKFNRKSFHYDVPENIYGALYNRIINDSCIIKGLCKKLGINPENISMIKYSLGQEEILEKELNDGFADKCNSNFYVGDSDHEHDDRIL